MPELNLLLLACTVASWIYWLVAWWMVIGFFRSGLELGIDTGDGYTPPVSMLKPVKGLDAEAYENFASFCRQDYPDFELLFGVADAGDPVIPVIQRLQRDYPRCSIRLVIAPDVAVTAMNHKAGLLAELTSHAQSEVLAISDSDMRAAPDYLRRVVAPLRDERVGLVTCLYRARQALTLTARLEALYMGVTFLPSVLVGRKALDMHFALGATAVLRRADLERMGGFAILADYLADDHELGARIADLGLRVCLSDYIVDCALGATTFREQWNREVRWAQCNRVSRPWGYAGLLLTFSTPLAALLVLASGLAAYAWLALLASILLRWVVAWSVSHTTRDWESRRWLPLLPVRDMLSACVWCAGELSRRVVWRGETFLLRPDGRLQPLSPLEPGLKHEDSS